jgi:hypothetical protein
MASSVLGEKAAKQLERIPLSNDTVSGRISDIPSNVKEELIEKVKASKYYSVQLYESTDVSNIAHLTFIRFEDEESVREELLFCEPLLGRTTSNDIFKKLDRFMRVHGIEWKKWPAFAPMKHGQ